MNQNFPSSLERILHLEGGFSNHPLDPGGATNMGITQKTLARWRGHAVTVNDVKNLTQEEASDIYKAYYWNPVAGDLLPSGVDLLVFDCAVNQGVGRAVKLLQKALRVTQDGLIGPQTLGAAGNSDPNALMDEFAARRAVRYSSLPTVAVFGLGWFRRLFAARAAAAKLTT